MASASVVSSAAVWPCIAVVNAAYASSTAWRGRIGVARPVEKNDESTDERTKSTVRGSTTRTTWRTGDT
jgi:hypothetical protein